MAIRFLNGIDAEGRKILQVGDPTDDKDAANKAYVDGEIPSLTNYVTLNTTQTISGAKTFSSNVELASTADLVFKDLNGTFPTSGKGFDWTLNNDGARIYAIQPSSDSIDFVFQLRDNATTNDRFVFHVDDYQGASYDKYPLIIKGGTQFDLVDSSLYTDGTIRLSNAGALTVTSGTFTGAVYVDEHIYHNGDTNTYIQFPGTNDKIVFATNGSDVLTLDATNNATFAGSITVPSIYYDGLDIGGVSGVNHINFAAGKIAFIANSTSVGNIYSGGFRPSANNTFALGTTTSKWSSVYATTFSGDLNGTINTATTGVTQSQGNNSTKIATTAYVDAAAGGVPIGNYLPLAGGTLTGALTGTDATFTGLVTTKIYKVTSVSISNSYVRVAEIDEIGNQLSSTVRVTMTAHGGSHVTTCNAIISVGHSQDILIQSDSLAYTQVTLKVDSNNNGQWTLSVKSNSPNASTYEVDIQGLSHNLTITPLPTASQTGTTLEHTTNFGTNVTGVSSNAPSSAGLQSRFGGNVFLDNVDTNNSNTSALFINTSSKEVEKRTLGAGAFGPTPVGAYLPLAGGTMTGVTQFNDHTQHGDQVQARWGASNDLTIEHDGSNSYIKDAGTGNLEIRSNFLKVKSPTAEDMIWAQENAAVSLFYNNVLKLATTNTGVGVEGQVTASTDKATPQYSFKGDTDTGLIQYGGTADSIGFMLGGKDALSMPSTGKLQLHEYDAVAVSSSGGEIDPNQNFQAGSQDTLALLAVDPSGQVVRGSQEATWTFTKAQIDALTTSTTSGTTLIKSPGTNKAIIVEESNLMIKYSGTGTMSSNSFVIRQGHNGDAGAEVTRLPSGQINTIMSSAPTNPSYGFYSRDLPLYNNDGRSFVTDKATFLTRTSTNATPSNLLSITIKLKYRLFNVLTFD